VLYKVPESNADRAEDNNKADIAFCLQLFNNAWQMGVIEEDLVHVFRLGRRGDENNPRPLMVQLASYTSKNLFLESLFKLKDADLKYERVVVAHDLTKVDHEECKRLVAQAKTMAQEQDALGNICSRQSREMGIVKIKQRN